MTPGRLTPRVCSVRGEAKIIWGNTQPTTAKALLLLSFMRRPSHALPALAPNVMARHFAGARLRGRHLRRTPHVPIDIDGDTGRSATYDISKSYRRRRRPVAVKMQVFAGRQTSALWQNAAFSPLARPCAVKPGIASAVLLQAQGPGFLEGLYSDCATAAVMRTVGTSDGSRAFPGSSGVCGTF